MDRVSVRKVFLIGLVVWIVGAVVVALTTRTGEVTNASVYDVGLLVTGAGAVIVLISWIMALVASAALGSWGWFVVVLILGLVGVFIPIMVIYSFAGPTRGSTSPRPQLPLPVG